MSQQLDRIEQKLDRQFLWIRYLEGKLDHQTAALQSIQVQLRILIAGENEEIRQKLADMSAELEKDQKRLADAIAKNGPPPTT